MNRSMDQQTDGMTTRLLELLEAAKNCMLYHRKVLRNLCFFFFFYIIFFKAWHKVSYLCPANAGLSLQFFKNLQQRSWQFNRALYFVKPVYKLPCLWHNICHYILCMFLKVILLMWLMVTPADTWHLTPDTWHLIPDSWRYVNVAAY